MADDLTSNTGDFRYVSIDREAIRQNYASLASENVRVRSFLASELGSPEDVGAAMSDRDWLSGYGAGLEDAAKISRGLSASGPGISSERGWRSRQIGDRAEGYYAGLGDGQI